MITVSQKRLAFALLLLTLSAVGAYVRLAFRSVDLDVYFDSYGYLLMARALRGGEFVLEYGTIRRVPFHPPGYPAAILVIAGFAETEPAHPALASALMGALAAPLAGLAGAALFGMRAGLLAAALWSLNPLHVAYSQIAMADTTAVALTLGGAAVWLGRGGPVTALPAGIAFALGFLTRYVELLSFAWLILLAPRRAGGRLDRKIAAAMALAVCLLPFALWQVTRLGLTQSTYSQAGQTFDWHRAFEASKNAWMYRPELGHLPAYLYFLATGDGRPFVTLCHSALLVPLGLVVLVRGGRRDRTIALWLLSWVVAQVLVCSTLWTSEPRYMIPVYIPLTWLASAGLVSIGRRARVLATLLTALLVLPPIYFSYGAIFVDRPASSYRRLSELLAHCPDRARIVAMSSMAIQVYDPARASRAVEPHHLPVGELASGSQPSCIVVDPVMNQYGRPWLDQACGAAGTCNEIATLPGLELRVLTPTQAASSSEESAPR